MAAAASCATKPLCLPLPTPPSRPNTTYHLSRLSSSATAARCRPRNCTVSSLLWASSITPEIRGPLLLGSFQSRFSCLAAAGNMTAVPSDCTGDSPSKPIQSDDVTVYEKIRESDEGVGEDNAGRESVDGQKMVKVCDKLIDIFLVDKPTPTHWRRMLAGSKEWSNIRCHFYKRCKEKAEAESDPGMKHKLLRLGRKLKEVDDDVQRHNELLEVIGGASSEISAIITRRRKDFTKEFFEHLHIVAMSHQDNPTAYDELVKLQHACLAAVQAYDTTIQSNEAAKLMLQDIFKSPSVSTTYKNIDTLAENSQLNSDLMLKATKAWSDGKDTTMVKDEAKDALYHLYKQAVANQQRMLPKEVRILKHLIVIEDPEEQLCILKDAFTPGDEVEGEDIDFLCTTPEKLYALIKSVVDAYHNSKERTLMGEVKDLMNPKVIRILEDLKQKVQNNFL